MSIHESTVLYLCIRPCAYNSISRTATLQVWYGEVIWRFVQVNSIIPDVHRRNCLSFLKHRLPYVHSNFTSSTESLKLKADQAKPDQARNDFTLPTIFSMESLLLCVITEVCTQDCSYSNQTIQFAKNVQWMLRRLIKSNVWGTSVQSILQDSMIYTYIVWYLAVYIG